MKKFIFGLIMAIVCLLGTSAFIACDSACQKLSTVAVDSAVVADAIDKYHNPQYTDVTEFVKYCEDESQYQDFVNISHGLHKNTITTIATSCIKRNGFVDYKSFLSEFREHEITYLNVDEVNWKTEQSRLDRSDPNNRADSAEPECITDTEVED